MIQNEEIKCSFKEIPFKTTLSFEYLIAELTQIANDKVHPMRDSAVEIIRELEKVPDLQKSVEDRSLIEKHRDIVDRMMAFVFNPMNDQLELGLAATPFVPDLVYTTSLFNQVFMGDHRKLEMADGLDEEHMIIPIIYQAYLVILNKFYDIDVNIEIPFTFKLTDEEDRSTKYYKLKVNSRFVEVKVHGKLKKLTKKDLKKLFDNASNLDYWNKVIPLSNFEFIGFLQFEYFNITQEYVISQLKSDLLDKNSILTTDGFNRIKEKVRALVELPDLEFGLAAVSDFKSGMNQNLIWKTIIPQEELKCEEYIGTFYEKAYKERRLVITDDFENTERNKVVTAFIMRGLRSHAVIPLFIEDELVGMVEFSSKEAGWLSLVQINRFHELFPVFALALRRSREEWNDRIRAVIQEEFTAIHPTVAWRFREVASKILDENTDVDLSNLEHIVFSDVVPVYGATDIRNSSVERNRAIQSDLGEHLSLVKTVLVRGMKNKEMPLLNNLAYKIEKHMQTVNEGLKAGDEVSILDFFKKEIEPVFRQLRLREKELEKVIDDYFDRMDPDLGVLYNKRRDFEDSLTRINEEISDILDKEQVNAQRVFPHYFEKYRTDGVEYNIYIGQSLVNNLEYNEIYLKNIRLWQLMTMVSVARRTKLIKPYLKTPLDVTQLILVQSNPLSIAFRQDEKKFDVAGAYNIRYEITKKRIDKAVIKGTRERVTQVDKIAIIYSLADEIDEYRNYLTYMIEEGYLKDNIEYLELEDLQGASGLRAMRVSVNYDGMDDLDEVDISEINEFLKNN